MATIPLAQSLELNKIVDAAEAESAFEQGYIRSKRLFECIDDNCNAQITCANLDKAPKNRKKEPHFRYVGDHSDLCQEKIKIEERERKFNEDFESKSRPTISTKFAFFNEGVSSHIKNVNATSSPHNSLDKKLARSQGQSTDNTSNSSRTSKKTLSAWAEAFEKDEDMYMGINGEFIHINNLFVNLDEIEDLTDLDEELRIYYGTTWIKSNPTGIKFIFKKPLKLNNLVQRPSLMLFSNKIKDEPTNGRFSENTLINLASRKTKNNKDAPVTLFILSELPPQLSKCGKFINFYIKSLGYVYYKK